MIFLNPLALFALGFALVPPLLHLFERRRPPEVPFPAVRYLKQTEREAERTIRLRHLLLMLLRVLAVALIVLSASRPVVRGGRLGVHEPTALAIVLDNSLSSGAAPGGARVLDVLAARARETLLSAQSADALWLITADGLARRGTADELIEATSGVRPESRRLDLSEAVAAASRVIAASGYARGEIHLLTDLQRTAWGSGPDSAALGLSVIVHHPAADPPANLGVAGARPTPSVWLRSGGSVAVRVVGDGGERRRVTAALTIDGASGGRALVGPGEEVALQAARVEPGWRVGTVSLEADELLADDTRPFAARVVPPSSVAVAPGADLGRFMGEALAVLAEGRQVVATTGSGSPVWLGDAPRGDRSVVFPPADPALTGAANRALAAAGVRWRIAERVEREDSLTGPEVPELAGSRVTRRWRLTPLAAGAEAGVLARAGGDPWLVRDGGVVLVGSRPVPEETSLPLGGGFVPFVGALVNRIAGGEAGVLEAAPMGPVRLPDRVSAMGRGGDSVVSVEPGSVIAAPGETGAYPLLAGADTVAMLVVAPDPRESDLLRADRRTVESLLPGALLTITDDLRLYAASRFRGAGRTELTGWLLSLALLVLVVEALLAAGVLGRRRTG